jgi:hypothetical protein
MCRSRQAFGVCLRFTTVSAEKERLSQTKTRLPKPTLIGNVLSCEFLTPTVSV